LPAPPTDDELYPLLHKHTPILRYPTAHAAAKLAVTGALASLNPAWAAAWERGGPFHAVRVIMASWGCVYRLAFLVATGQAGSTTLFAALRATHAAFTRDYPDYAAWLDGWVLAGLQRARGCAWTSCLVAAWGWEFCGLRVGVAMSA
jgi:hypothetical protein